MTPLEAAQVIATAQVDADAAKRRAAGYTDMLWGLLLPAILLSLVSQGLSDPDDLTSAQRTAARAMSNVLTYGLAIGGLVLSFFVTRNQAISLAPPVRSAWFWVAIALLPGALFVVFAVVIFGSFTDDMMVTPGVRRGFLLMSLLTKWGALAVGASYVLGRGMYLRKVSWYDRPWAVVAGVLLVLVTTALVLYDATGGGFIGRIEGGTSLHVTALLLGTTWFTHGALLYTRG